MLTVFITVNASLRWLNNVSCLFLSFLLYSQVEYNCSLIKVDWLAACIALRVVGAVLVVILPGWHKIYKICTILQPMGSKDRPMSLTLLTNKRQGNLEYVQAANIIKPTLTRDYHNKHTICVTKALNHRKKLKNGPVPFLGLVITIHASKSQIHLARQSL